MVYSCLAINAGVFQGSAVGPPLFLINGYDLKPKFVQNFLDKYADDSYLIVGASSEDTIPEELLAIDQWAVTNNLKLNQFKCKEIIFHQNRKAHAYVSYIPVTLGLERVTSLNILGVTIKGDFSVDDHVAKLCNGASQSFYALKILKNSGLKKDLIFQVFNSLILSKIMYASAAWRGFVTQQQLSKLQSIINKAVRWGLTIEQDIDLLFSNREDRLFNSILDNDLHVLHYLLPPYKENPYNLRVSTSHGRELPKKTMLLEKNFLIRMLYKDVT